MNHNLDFLPARYREQSSVRKSKLWQLAVVLLFGGVIATTAIAQQWVRRAVAQRLEQVGFQHDVALANIAQYDNLRAETAEVRATADLYAYLRHPVPRAQILAATVAPVMESIHLTDVDITRESVRGRETFPVRTAARGHAEQDQASSRLQPAERDVQRLRDESDNTRTVVRVDGVSTRAADVHGYIAALTDNHLFSSVELISLEAAPRDATGVDARFTLRLVVRSRLAQEDASRPAATRRRQARDARNADILVRASVMVLRRQVRETKEIADKNVRVTYIKTGAVR